MNVGGAGTSGRQAVNTLFPECNSETVRNILMIFGRIIEKVSADCHMHK